MKPVFIIGALVLISASGFAQDSKAQGKASLLRTSRQLLLVITDKWDSVNGTLARFERGKAQAPWKVVGSPVPVVIGKSGLAWDRGLQPQLGSGPVKKEGDGKSPAGVFRLDAAFGQSSETPAGLRMQYRFLRDDVECVDDSQSSFYNRLISRREAATADWKSSEKMWEEPLYKRGVVVDYNSAHQPGAGSCIFLHIWRGAGQGTAGCTAMSEDNLTALMTWLEAENVPVLVQLPRSEYARLKHDWRLP